MQPAANNQLDMTRLSLHSSLVAFAAPQCNWSRAVSKTVAGRQRYSNNDQTRRHSNNDQTDSRTRKINNSQVANQKSQLQFRAVPLVRGSPQSRCGTPFVNTTCCNQPSLSIQPFLINCLQSQIITTAMGSWEASPYFSRQPSSTPWQPLHRVPSTAAASAAAFHG